MHKEYVSKISGGKGRREGGLYRLILLLFLLFHSHLAPNEEREKREGRGGD
jgi:hypothetical protein